MRLYQKNEDLSTLGGIALVLLSANTCSTVYAIGEWLVWGTSLTGWLLVPPVISAVLLAGCLARGAVKLIERLRRPKRYGMIPPEMIRRAMEVRR